MWGFDDADTLLGFTRLLSFSLNSMAWYGFYLSVFSVQNMVKGSNPCRFSPSILNPPISSLTMSNVRGILPFFLATTFGILNGISKTLWISTLFS